MKITRIYNRNRRDFTATYQCEHCQFEREGYGYDDRHFHENVVPDMLCPECGKKSPVDFEPRTPRYPEGVQV